MNNNWLGIIVYLFLVLSLAALSHKAQSADLEQAMRDAAKYSRYDVPNRMPHIVTVSTDEIDMIVPPIAGRSAYAYYRHDKKTIYRSGLLDQMYETDPVKAHSWDLHESVHYLQDLAGRKFKTCADRKLRESEAYHVQSEYLKSKGRSPQRFSARMYPCTH